MANCNKLVGHTWEGPLVYMVSPMASTCDPYATKCTKAEPKILQVKRGQKQRNAPDSARKRRNRVRCGCWRGVQQMRTVGKPEIRTKMHQIAMQHMKKGNPRKPSVFAGFLAGAEGLVSAAASVGPGRSPPGCRPPRHAPQAGLRAHLVAKSYRTLTKKSGTAEAIPDFFGRGRRT